MKRRTWMVILGVVLSLIALGVLVLLAILGSDKKPPSSATQGLLVLVAAVSQIGAGWAFARLNTVDPARLQAAVRRLELLRVRAAEARRVTDTLADQPSMPVGDRRELLGQLSVQGSWVQEEVVQAMSDWYEAMPHVAERVARELRAQGANDD